METPLVVGELWVQHTVHPPWLGEEVRPIGWGNPKRTGVYISPGMELFAAVGWIVIGIKSSKKGEHLDLCISSVYHGTLAFEQ